MHFIFFCVRAQQREGARANAWTAIACFCNCISPVSERESLKILYNSDSTAKQVYICIFMNNNSIQWLPNFKFKCTVHVPFHFQDLSVWFSLMDFAFAFKFWQPLYVVVHKYAIIHTVGHIMSYAHSQGKCDCQ